MLPSAGIPPQLVCLLTEAARNVNQFKAAVLTRCMSYVHRKYKKLVQFKERQQELLPDCSTPLEGLYYPHIDLQNLPPDWLQRLSTPTTKWVNTVKEPWNISYVSSASFFTNKHGFDVDSIGNTKVTPGHAFLRHSFLKRQDLNNWRGLMARYASTYSSRNRILYLEDQANENQDNPDLQAEYLKAIVQEDPEYVIRRYESGKYAVNDDVKVQYLKALALTERLTESEIQALTVGSGSASTQYATKRASTDGPLGRGVGSEEQPVHVVMAPPKGSFFREQFWNTLRFLIGLFLILSVIESQLQMKMNTNQKEVMPDQSDKRYKFSDVQGVDEAKQELQEVVDFLRFPDKFQKLGGKLPTGLLLIGPPGTGKTLLARAVAGEAGVPFFFCSGSEFDEMFVGVGAARVRNLFSAAKEHAPCIVFIDELDAIGGTRIPNDHQPYSRMTLNQLLVELDGFDKTEGIVVIGATNFPEILDKALTRPGRFDSRVIVPMPDVRGRKEILELYLKKVTCADDVIAEVIARGTPGFSGADLNNLVNQAAIRAAVENDKVVKMKHLEWAKDKIVMGPERKSAVIEEKNRVLVAYHESGHAIVALNTPDALPVHKATIMPRGQALGMVSQLPEKDELSWSKKQLLAKLDVSMGGRVAEELIFGQDSITTGASSDMENATKIATAMVTKYGMSSKIGTVLIESQEKLSPTLQSLIESEVKQLLEDSYTRAKNTLITKSKEHKLLAEALLKYETLDADEIKLVIQGKRLQRTL